MKPWAILLPYVSIELRLWSVANPCSEASPCLCNKTKQHEMGHAACSPFWISSHQKWDQVPVLCNAFHGSCFTLTPFYRQSLKDRLFWFAAGAIQSTRVRARSVRWGSWSSLFEACLAMLPFNDSCARHPLYWAFLCWCSLVLWHTGKDRGSSSTGTA